MLGDVSEPLQSLMNGTTQVIGGVFGVRGVYALVIAFVGGKAFQGINNDNYAALPD